jgi:hypothetical protein
VKKAIFPFQMECLVWLEGEQWPIEEPEQRRNFDYRDLSSSLSHFGRFSLLAPGRAITTPNLSAIKFATGNIAVLTWHDQFRER